MTRIERLLRRLGQAASRTAGLTALALLAFAGSARAQDAGWAFKLTPYFMASGLDGDVGVRGRSVPVDVSFTDIADHLNFAALGAIEARRNRWMIGADVMYMDLGADGDIPLPGQLLDRFEVDASLFLLNPHVGYRATRPGPVSLDLLGGIRYWHVSNDLMITGTAGSANLLDGSKDWVDPIVGARFQADFDDHWFGLARGDIGGFGVGADFTWQALGAIGYSIDVERHYSLLAGWRQLDVDYEDDGFLWDVAMGGPTIAFSFAW